MKQISFFLAAAMLIWPAVMHAQDAATEERLNKLSAQIQDLIIAKDAQNKRIEDLASAIRDLQDQQGKPNPTYATQDDLKMLAGKLEEVDSKRREDNEKLVSELKNISKAVTDLAKAPVITKPVVSSSGGGTSAGEKPHYEYTIRKGDTLSAVIAAYKEQGINVKLQDILDANPKLDPKNMSVGLKVIIPAP